MLTITWACVLSVVNWGVNERPDTRENLMRAVLEQDRLWQAFADGQVEGSRSTAHAKIQHRKKAKILSLKSRPMGNDLDDISFTIRVELIGLFGDHPEVMGGHPGTQTSGCAGGVNGSRVAVSLHVPSNITLQELHSQAIAPANGFRRRYHAYFFTDPTDGAQFGIEGKGHPIYMWGARFGLGGPVDLMHMRHYGHEVIDDRTVRLGMLLRRNGERLFYLSDLGDVYNYSVTLLDMIPGAMTRVKVIDAICPRPPVSVERGAHYSPDILTCPHEDGDGSRAWCERHVTPIKNKGIPWHRVYRDREALLEEIQARLDDAATRPPSIDDDGHSQMSGYDERTGRLGAVGADRRLW